LFLAGSIGLYFVSLGFVFQEWLFEMPIGSIPCSEHQHHADLKKDFVNYFKSFFM